ncbi:V-type ATP synthase subunit I [Flexibacterium corallicola]|uniref:V-type ATP synthase subunit I n=1 Tax=Flexibacterium corallicola TaxID=3037259 RepID=UPI00286ECEF3|nr:hypothetical protein [Pseudovibrio sp. M1P-2-3]
MTVVSLKKATLIFDRDQSLNLMTHLQNLGCCHIVNLSGQEKSVKHRQPPSQLEDFKSAIAYLESFPHKRKPAKSFKHGSAVDIVLQARLNQNRKRDVEDRLAFLEARIKDVSVWGNFQLPDEGELDDLRLWFYQIPISDIDRISSDLILEEITRSNREVYLVAVSPAEPPTKAMPRERIHMGSHSLGTLQSEYDALQVELEDLEDERRTLTKFLYLLRKNVARVGDKHALLSALDSSLIEPDLGIIQGWIPEGNIQELKVLASEHCSSLYLEAPEDDETPPTLLENAEPVQSGEEIVKFYELPGYGGTDPSIPLFLSFILFFAMIMADAGYGLVMLVATLYYWRKLGESSGQKSFRPLYLALSLATILYGVLAGSFFGTSLLSDGIFSHLKLVDVTDITMMMTISLAIGSLHLAYANFAEAMNRRLWRNRIAPLGWVSVIAGGGLMALHYLLAPNIIAQWAGFGLGGLGLAMVFFYGNPIPVTNIKTALFRFLGGLESLTKLSKLFGDILSYLRLFALGLAGVSLATTFNSLAIQVKDSVEGAGTFLAIIIVVLGHSLNIVLAAASGIIHGLRLNLIEYFNWAVEVEGKPFIPLKKKEIEP